MSEKRTSGYFRKKYSLNSDSTNLNSSNPGTNRVIQTQKLISNKLIDHLYGPKVEEIKPLGNPFFNSPAETCEKT
jgi:hypothetical protein